MNETTKVLCHEWSKAQKAAYNREYYRKHKEYWQALAETNKKMDSAAREVSSRRKVMNDKSKTPSTADAYQYWKKMKENRSANKDAETLSSAMKIQSKGYDPNIERENLKKMRQYGYNVRNSGNPNASEVQEYYKAKQKYNAAMKDRKTIERANKIVSSRSKTSAKTAKASESTSVGQKYLERMRALSEL